MLRRVIGPVSVNPIALPSSQTPKTTKMKIPEHLALSSLLAQFQVQPSYGVGGTVLVLVAGMLPDLDGISILGGWNCHLKYHRKLGHGILMTLLGPLALALTGSLLLDL